MLLNYNYNRSIFQVNRFKIDQKEMKKKALLWIVTFLLPWLQVLLCRQCNECLYYSHFDWLLGKAHHEQANLCTKLSAALNGSLSFIFLSLWFSGDLSCQQHAGIIFYYWGKANFSSNSNGPRTQKIPQFAIKQMFF